MPHQDGASEATPHQDAPPPLVAGALTTKRLAQAPPSYAPPGRPPPSGGRYNAHTTGSDAPWRGVPSVGGRGGAMPSRVGGSLLRASGQSCGLVHSMKEYADVAASLVSAGG